MSHKLEVEQDDATQSCMIFIDRRPVIDPDLGTLRHGEHSLTYDVRGAGATVKISIAGDPTTNVIIPAGATWPFKVTVPDDRTGEADRIYFVVGG
jgi:hypothetical protein